MIPKVEEATLQEDRSSMSISSLVGSSRQESVSTLEIIIALRGSGDIGDFVSDSMLNATSYRSGLAHDGILKSGKFLAKLHIEKIRDLWEVSGRDMVQVLLVGYSLGAGVAAIAAMELNEYDFIGKCMYTLYTFYTRYKLMPKSMCIRCQSNWLRLSSIIRFRTKYRNKGLHYDGYR